MYLSVLMSTGNVSDLIWYSISLGVDPNSNITEYLTNRMKNELWLNNVVNALTHPMMIVRNVESPPAIDMVKQFDPVAYLYAINV